MARVANTDPAVAAEIEAQWRIARQALEADRDDTARGALQRVLDLDPSRFMARLYFASLLDKAGLVDDAVVQYYGAVNQAQREGRWLNEETTAPALRELVLHAMRTINGGRRSRFEAVLAPLQARHGDAALARAQACLDVYLGDAPAHHPDPRQRPKFLYFPGLPATPFFDRAAFPWYAELESQLEVVRSELLEALEARNGIEPFLKFSSAEQAVGYLAGDGAAPNWDAFFFYRHGVRNDANCAQCPRTAAIIDALPIVRIREHAPEICFSMLTPGTHILPHRGVTNTRAVTHFPLIVPDDCALVVGGEKREWREGECFTFDDTFEHEAWNRGKSVRVVMLMDSWNPYLTDVEREAVSLLVEAIGDFNRAAGIVEA